MTVIKQQGLRKKCMIIYSSQAENWPRLGPPVHIYTLLSIVKLFSFPNNRHGFQTDLLSGEEEQDVSFHLLAQVDLDHRPDGCLQVVSLRLWREEDLHRVSSSWHTLCRCACGTLQKKTLFSHEN